MTTLIILIDFLGVWLFTTYILWEVENRIFWFGDLMGITLFPSIIGMLIISLLVKYV